MVTLQDSTLFSRLTPEELSALKWVAQERTFAADEPIFREGDPGDALYVVKEGLVQISALVGGERRVFAEIEPGSVFGEMAVLDYRPRSAAAHAKMKTVAYCLPRMEILRFIEKSPVLALTFLQVICERQRNFNQQYLREVVQVERLATVGRLARSIIHDLKNPLSIIGLSAELTAKEASATESSRRAMQLIGKQVGRITQLVSEVLDFARGQTQATLLEPINYAAFIQQCVEDSRQELALKSVNVIMKGTPPAVTVKASPKRLERVLLNLFQNAADAMKGGGRITLTFQNSLREVITEVADAGPGIAPEIADHLFEPFATHGKEHGTGLGLSICRRILEDHKGWIAARSEPGRGAVFSFGLPL